MKRIEGEPSGMLSSEEMRRQRIKEAWRQKRSFLLSRIHSEEADRKRTDSLRRWHREHPAAVTPLMRKVLGENPRQKLEELKGLSLSEASEMLGIGKDTISIWYKKMDVVRKKEGVGIVWNENRMLVEEARAKGMLERLPSYWREVIDRRYPVEGLPANLRQIADEFGVRHQGIHEQEKKALGDLREWMGKKEK